VRGDGLERLGYEARRADARRLGERCAVRGLKRTGLARVQLLLQKKGRGREAQVKLTGFKADVSDDSCDWSKKRHSNNWGAWSPSKRKVHRCR